ncbi:MAG: hypothetical protein AAF611_08425 [Bacteroidota bacterium]
MAETKDLEKFKYLIDSRKLSKSEKERERELLAKARKERYASITLTETKIAKLLQLKYQMEAYIDDANYNTTSSFERFLAAYVDILYEKRKNFAEDISVTPIFLSHVINKHREPKESFIKRLIVHSRDTYKSISEFSLDLWLKVYYQDKVSNFLRGSKKWEKSEEKYVKSKFIKSVK